MTGTMDRLTPKLLAAASVLGLSLGMAAQAADSEQLKGENTQGQTTSTQVKGQTDQHKLSSGFLKQNSHKGATGPTSNQIKWNGVSNQHKLETPSNKLNPQPEPPSPRGTGTLQNNTINPQPEPPAPDNNQTPQNH